MRIAYLGTPVFAAAVLCGLLENKNHQVVCVVTQPDAAVGRGQRVQMTPVKAVAVAHQIPVLQPEKISADVTALAAYRPDILVTCAFGQILRQNVLDVAPHGVINVHGSLLPKYRGAAPVQWAVLNGDRQTGITIAQTELGLDCGPIITTAVVDIDPKETAGDLFARLPAVALPALVTALDQIAAGTATFTPQDDRQATKAPMLNKAMARLDWRLSAAELVNRVRGLNPWPVACGEIDGQILKIYRATALPGDGEPGQIVQCDASDGVVVACGTGRLRLDEVQLAGKKRLPGTVFACGRDLTGRKFD